MPRPRVDGAAADDGARNPLLGVFGVDLVGLTEGMLPVLFRVLFIGRAGNAMFGGPRDGRDGRGRVVAMFFYLGSRGTREKVRIAR